MLLCQSRESNPKPFGPKPNTLMFTPHCLHAFWAGIHTMCAGYSNAQRFVYVYGREFILRTYIASEHMYRAYVSGRQSIYRTGICIVSAQYLAYRAYAWGGQYLAQEHMFGAGKEILFIRAYLYSNTACAVFGRAYLFGAYLRGGQEKRSGICSEQSSLLKRISTVHTGICLRVMLVVGRAVGTGAYARTVSRTLCAWWAGRVRFIVSPYMCVHSPRLMRTCVCSWVL